MYSYGASLSRAVVVVLVVVIQLATVLILAARLFPETHGTSASLDQCDSFYTVVFDSSSRSTTTTTTI